MYSCFRHIYLPCATYILRYLDASGVLVDPSHVFPAPSEAVASVVHVSAYEKQRLAALESSYVKPGKSLEKIKHATSLTKSTMLVAKATDMWCSEINRRRTSMR